VGPTSKQRQLDLARFDSACFSRVWLGFAAMLCFGRFTRFHNVDNCDWRLTVSNRCECIDTIASQLAMGDRYFYVGNRDSFYDRYKVSSQGGILSSL